MYYNIVILSFTYIIYCCGSSYSQTGLSAEHFKLP